MSIWRRKVPALAVGGIAMLAASVSVDSNFFDAPRPGPAFLPPRCVHFSSRGGPASRVWCERQPTTRALRMPCARPRRAPVLAVVPDISDGEALGLIRSRLNPLHGEVCSNYCLPTCPPTDGLLAEEGPILTCIRDYRIDRAQDAEVVLRQGLEALRDVHVANCTPTTENFNYILYAVGRARNCSPALLDRALEALTQQGLQANTKSYNLLISASKLRGGPRRVGGAGDASGDPLARTLDILTRMKSARVLRDDFTYTLIFSACSRAARTDGPRGLRLAREFVREMGSDGVEPSTFTLNAAIDTCAKSVTAGAPVSSCLDLALSLFAQLRCEAAVRDEISALSGRSRWGRSSNSEARPAMLTREARGLVPDSGCHQFQLHPQPRTPQPQPAATPVTYTSLLDLACSALRCRTRSSCPPSHSPTPASNLFPSTVTPALSPSLSPSLHHLLPPAGLQAVCRQRPKKAGPGLIHILSITLDTYTKYYSRSITRLSTVCRQRPERAFPGIAARVRLPPQGP